MGLKNILVLNDEAHHCYREKPGEEDELNFSSVGTFFEYEALSLSICISLD